MALFGICEIKPLLTASQNLSNFLRQPLILTQVRNYAARKGTRDKRNKKKVKVEDVKVGFIPHNQRDKEKFLANRPKRKFDDSWKPDPIDNVYPFKYYKWPVYSFVDAVHCHRETHHPDIYNRPNANLHVSIELNMEGEKKNKFLDNFTRITAIPHTFDHGENRSILAFSKDVQQQERAREAGAQLSGGTELIKQIQNGEISLQDFQFIIAHPNILPELVTLRGLMRKKFPNPKMGTLDANVEEMVKKFLHGINYTAVKDEYEKDFGLIETILGTLNMEPAHLEANFSSLLNDLWLNKPKRKNDFIRRCLLWSPPSCEKFKVDHKIYVGLVSDEETGEDEEEPAEAIEAKA